MDGFREAIRILSLASMPELYKIANKYRIFAPHFSDNANRLFLAQIIAQGFADNAMLAM